VIALVLGALAWGALPGASALPAQAAEPDTRRATPKVRVKQRIHHGMDDRAGADFNELEGGLCPNDVDLFVSWTIKVGLDPVNVFLYRQRGDQPAEPVGLAGGAPCARLMAEMEWRLQAAPDASSADGAGGCVVPDASLPEPGAGLFRLQAGEQWWLFFTEKSQLSASDVVQYARLAPAVKGGSVESGWPVFEVPTDKVVHIPLSVHALVAEDPACQGPQPTTDRSPARGP